MPKPITLQLKVSLSQIFDAEILDVLAQCYEAGHAHGSGAHVGHFDTIDRADARELIEAVRAHWEQRAYTAPFLPTL